MKINEYKKLFDYIDATGIAPDAAREIKTMVVDLLHEEKKRSVNEQIDFATQYLKTLDSVRREAEAHAIEGFMQGIKNLDRYKFYEENKELKVLRFEEDLEALAKGFICR